MNEATRGGPGGPLGGEAVWPSRVCLRSRLAEAIDQGAHPLEVTAMRLF
jgi:hypothetical protein